MTEMKKAFSIAGYNFRLWRGNPRILVTFLLAFILCFLLSDKAVQFAVDHNTTMQIVEVFIWNFGDSNSILLSSVLLVLLFADMPFLSSGTPLYLVRTSRRTWITGQVLYILSATLIYLVFCASLHHLFFDAAVVSCQYVESNSGNPGLHQCRRAGRHPRSGKNPGNELALPKHGIHFLSDVRLHLCYGHDHAGMQPVVRSSGRSRQRPSVQRLWHSHEPGHHSADPKIAG